tara:strand:- start:102 stop:536 length:435 start_codon:yes stop_codon:yes gene_type:complete
MEDFEARIKTLQEGYSLVEEFINTGFKSKEKECWRTVYFFAEWLNEKGIKDIKLVEGFGWKDDSPGIDENFYHWNLIYKDRWLDVASMVKGENFKSFLVEPKTKGTPIWKPKDTVNDAIMTLKEFKDRAFFYPELKYNIEKQSL